jgi:DNA-binding NarL/FixJ family response regulator
VIRVLLADDHTIVRQGLASILKGSGEAEVVAEAKDGNEAVDKALEVKPDVVVLDISMPRLSGLEAARRIKRLLPRCGVLVLTMHDEDEFVLKMIKGGVSGYLVKDGAAPELLAAIRAVAAGKGYFGSQASRTLAEAWLEGKPVAQGPYERLTDREREVFQLIIEGKTNTQAGRLLYISPKTVDNHRTHLMEKLGVHSTAELVRFAAKRGLIK